MYQSGHFKADVVLDATFCTTPTIKGIIDNFRNSDNGAIDSSWRVGLARIVDTTGALTAPSTKIISSSEDGTWTMNSLGMAGQNPHTLHGVFKANFSNGNAASAYAEKQ